MRYPLVLDLETKYTFREFRQPEKLEITVVGVYDYREKSLKGYLESDLPKLYPILESASLIIGYNIDHFDMPVLSAYYPGDINQLKTFDLLKSVKEEVGRRFSLNDLSRVTLDKKKSGHGLQAIEFYKEGKIEELTKYCLDDVEITKELFEYGAEKGEIFYPSSPKTAVKVDWKKYMTYQGDNEDLSLTLPF